MSFYAWPMVHNMKLDCQLITTLVERWRFETHSFHFRGGEMMVTLQDVALLSGLPIDGHAITDEETLVHYARAYVLCMLGSSLLTDTTGNEISLQYLLLLSDIDVVTSCNWGVLVLRAHEIRMTTPDKTSSPRLTRGCRRWAWIQNYAQSPHQILLYYKNHLDRQSPSDLVRESYHDDRLEELNELSSGSSHLKRGSASYLLPHSGVALSGMGKASICLAVTCPGPTQRWTFRLE